jgi:hypothetical protein
MGFVENEFFAFAVLNDLALVNPLILAYTF